MRYRSVFHIAVLLFALQAAAQSTLDNTLSAIAKNNKTLAANRQEWEARKLEFNTGLTPPNPTVEYDYLFSNPASAGNQTDFTVSQAFDFPTAYSRKKKLAGEQAKQADLYLSSARQDILLQAKTACIKLVYYNKRYAQLARRMGDTEKMVQNFQVRLDKGDGNILDLNKANLQLIELKRDHHTTVSQINQLNYKLTELNGGTEIVFKDTVYPLIQAIPAFEELEKTYEENDPDRKILEQQKVVAQSNLAVSRSMVLPKIEVGYHYQGILGQVYSGIHTGVSIPLWENKNVVRQRKAEVTAAELDIDAHMNEHFFHIKHLYEDYINLKTTLEAYEAAKIDTSSRNRILLNKAFALGEISSTEYFMETTYFYTALNSFLETERDYHEAVATLLKYQL